MRSELYSDPHYFWRARVSSVEVVFGASFWECLFDLGLGYFRDLEIFGLCGFTVDIYF